MLAKKTICFLIGLTIIGMLFLMAGIVVPLFLKFEKDRAVQDLWLKKADYKKWGNVPGDLKVDLIRRIKLLNVTNPEGILKGEKPRLVEMPSLDYQELTTFMNWYYTDEEGNNYTQNVPTDYIAYQYNTTLARVNQTGIPIDPTTPVTAFNLNLYASFYALTHSPPPLYALPNLFDVVQAFQTDFYYKVISYALWNKFLANRNANFEYLTGPGKYSEDDARTILNDATYGWATWNSFQIWIEAYLELRDKTGMYDGVIEALNNHFQIPSLTDLIADGELIDQSVKVVKDDMITRYGGDDPETIMEVQWATAGVSENLPFDLGTLPNSTLFDFPSYLNWNLTFSYIPEVPYLLRAANLTFEDFSQDAKELLKIEYKYPINNKSMLTFNNIVEFFTDWADGNYDNIYKIYGFDKNKTDALATYLGGLALLPIDVNGFKTDFDGYSIMLARWTRGKLVRETNKLRYDVVWGLPARMLMCKWQASKTTCLDFLKNKEVCEGDYGWDISNWQDFQKLSIWIEASMKDITSKSYKELLNGTGLSDETLQGLLYTNLVSFLTESKPLFSEIATHYGCNKPLCPYDTLFNLQLGASKLTSNLPPTLTECNVKPTMTISAWYKDRYQQPIEWLHFSEIELPGIYVSQLFSYAAFLSPTPIRLFFNYYFTGDYEKVAETFAFTSKQLVFDFYDFFMKQIPGLKFFSTHTLEEWIDGYYDPFLVYLGQELSIYEGGYLPISFIAFNQINTPQVDTPDMNYAVVNSGLSDPSKILQFYKYYGSDYIRFYSPDFDTSSPTGYSYSLKDVWLKQFKFNGGEGFSLGIYVSKHEQYSFYLSDFCERGELDFDHQFQYKGFNAYKFIPYSGRMNTSATIPENYYFYQLPSGFDGFFNITSVIGAPVFLSNSRCYLCEEKAKEMYEIFAWDDKEMIEPLQADKESCESFITVEPITGACIQDMINIQANGGIYKDYFFTDIYETVEGKGLYLPMYQLQRSQNFTESMMEDTFGQLSQVNDIQEIIFYAGICTGAFILLIPMLWIAYVYRIRRFGGWKSPRASKKFTKAYNCSLADPKAEIMEPMDESISISNV